LRRSRSVMCSTCRVNYQSTGGRERRVLTRSWRDTGEMVRGKEKTRKRRLSTGSRRHGGDGARKGQSTRGHLEAPGAHPACLHTVEDVRPGGGGDAPRAAQRGARSLSCFAFFEGRGSNRVMSSMVESRSGSGASRLNLEAGRPAEAGKGALSGTTAAVTMLCSFHTRSCASAAALTPVCRTRQRRQPRRVGHTPAPPGARVAGAEAPPFSSSTTVGDLRMDANSSPPSPG